MHLRESQPADLPFLTEMLYEAVFWRDPVNRPSFEDGMAYPEVSKSLADWGGRAGDTAVVALVHSKPVGAAWYRYWIDDNFIRGYVDPLTPVIVIGVHQDYRHQGIGTKMIQWLLEAASRASVPEVSLMVSKDNYAQNLYRQCGFLEYADRGDSWIMVREIQTSQ